MKPFTYVVLFWISSHVTKQSANWIASIAVYNKSCTSPCASRCQNTRRPPIVKGQTVHRFDPSLAQPSTTPPASTRSSVEVVTVTVVQGGPLALLQQAVLLGVVEDSEVTEHVLVRHLDAEGTLGSDTPNRLPDVHCVDVLQPVQADVRVDERPWTREWVHLMLNRCCNEYTFFLNKKHHNNTNKLDLQN